MSVAYRVQPDGPFLDRVLAAGGEDLKKCFQCATCSVVCELSGGEKPFPRKEMVWAQWGLADRLVADPDIWLCHQCNDCTARCPRGARPGDVLSALRQETVEHYAVPQVLARAVNRGKYLPFLLIIPALLLLLALLLRDPIWHRAQGALHYLQHPGFYAQLFPHWLLIGFYSFFWGLSMLGALVGVVRFWRAMKAADEVAGQYRPQTGILASIVRTVTTIFRHDKFGQCQGRDTRRWAHLGAFYGFAALFLVSVWAVVALYMINPLLAEHNHLAYPFALWNPWKLLANAGCVALIAGCVLAIRDRRSGDSRSSASSDFDWIFVGLLLGVGITGLLTELLRLAAEPGAAATLTTVARTAYAVYFVHLVLVFQLLVYLPYSKFAHVLYRTVALVYAEHSGRNINFSEKGKV